MSPSFITLWKSALNKCFINQTLGITRQISIGLYLGKWIDQDVGANGYGGLFLENFRYTNGTRKIGPIIVKSGDITI